MDINEFFTEEKIHNIDINGQIFKYKEVNAGDELDWTPDYIDDVEIEEEGKKRIVKKVNLGKLSICKLRNIVEIPFSDDDLFKISGINKNFDKYSNQDKDKLFKKLNPTIYDMLVKAIDNINNKKKDYSKH